MKIWRPAEGCSSRLPLSISSASWSSVFNLTTLLVCSDKLVTTAYVWHNSNDTIKTQGRMIFFAKPPYLPLPPVHFLQPHLGNATYEESLKTEIKNFWSHKLQNSIKFVNFASCCGPPVFFAYDRDVNVIGGIVVFTFRILNVGWCITFKSLQTSSLQWLSFSRDLKMWEVFSYSDNWRKKLTTTNKLTLVVYLWNVTRSTLLSLL